MTRFLSHVLNDPRCGRLNEDTSRLFKYHEATKHTYDSVRSGAHYLDWRNQPDPFRTFEGAPITELPRAPRFPEIGTFRTIAALAETDETTTSSAGNGQNECAVLDIYWLSHLLWHSMAVSAWKKAPRGDSRYSLRVNPSSGNLHPTETYLALRGFTGLDDGLYHYRADRHAVELRSSGAWIEKLSEDLKIPWAAEAHIIIGLTSIFWREAWKYRDRAYRYCCHDLGHAMMSLLIAARALGLPGGVIAHFGDARMTRALGLAGADEAPMAFLVFPFNESRAHFSSSSPKTATESFLGVPNELSVEEVPYDLLLAMHCATILPDSIGTWPTLAATIAVDDERSALPRLSADISNAVNSSEAVDLSGVEIQESSVSSKPEADRDGFTFFRPADKQTSAPQRDASLAEVVRRRRSALDFNPRTDPMDPRDVDQLLNFATRDWPADWRGTFGRPLAEPLTKHFPQHSGQQARGANFVTLYLYLHRVRHCEPGVYRWERETAELVQLHRGNVERVAAFLSLEQPLAGNSCFTISMIANLAGASQVFGNRGYRYAYFEAGAIGQRLYLGAEALGWNATGIGAFYDDDVHRYLGLLEEGDIPVSTSLHAADQATLVMLDSPASRAARAQDPTLIESAALVTAKETGPIPHDSKTLPRQVIYHFAVGLAIPDPRIEA